MKLYCYAISPIDLWFGAMDRAALIKALLYDGHTDEEKIWAENEADWIESVSKRCFKRMEWAGDVNDGPWFFAVPSDGKMVIGCVIKQSRAGWTFVSSPHPLNWLNEYGDKATFVVNDHGAILNV